MMSTALGQWLRVEARNQDLSFREIADESDVSVTTVRKIARGEGTQIEHLVAVADVLGFDVRIVDRGDFALY